MPETAFDIENVFDERSNTRLVVTVRGLLVCAGFGILSALPGLTGDSLVVQLTLTCIGVLIVLSAVYLVALRAAAQGHKAFARRLVFTAWSTYPASLILLFDRDAPLFLQLMFTNISLAFLGLVQVGMLTLAGWALSKRWIALTWTLYLLASATIAIREAEEPLQFVSMMLICAMLCAMALYCGRLLLKDQDEALLASQGMRIEAQKLREDAAAARDHALAANTAKSRFLANMSHELRTPLNAILGYVELIQETTEELDNADVQADLTKVHGAGDHLLGLINAILDLSKIEAGRMDVHNTIVPLAPMLHDLVSTIRPLARAKELEVRLTLPTALPPLETDSQKLRQILLNLLANAVKFTDAGSIEVTAETRGQQVLFRIIDSGVGISPDRLPYIFDAFERTQAEITTRVGGTGLGLAISRRLARLLGGSVNASSQVGRGSTFTLTLPMEPPRVTPAATVTPPPSLPNRIRRYTLGQLTK